MISIDNYSLTVLLMNLILFLYVRIENGIDQLVKFLISYHFYESRRLL